ncbi:hypothetical protein G6Z94_11680 [Vibrio aestuarianus]|uniref:hypothetical protein n=1 Tax=Vibrio aestuarianus TaxID=28171 RepID=UPI0015930486|nr:hypothetical protein [Vibrio aestuarianus]NGZ17999.1 hypothetical protein [Vibrio aestuarianus]
MLKPLILAPSFERSDTLNTRLCQINATLVILEIALESEPRSDHVQNVVSLVTEQVEHCQQLNRGLTRGDHQPSK